MKSFVHVTRLFVILLLFGMTSCEKQLPLSEAIIGKWDVQTVKAVFYQGGVMKYETTFYLEINEISVQFADGGAGIWYEDGSIVGNFTWSLSGNIMTLWFGINSTEWNIEIDENTLIWSYSETEEINQVTYNVETFYTAKRSG